MHPSRTSWTHLVRSRHAKLRSRTSQSAQPISAGRREPGRLAKISGRAQLEHEMIDKSIVVVGTTKIEWPDKEGCSGEDDFSVVEKVRRSCSWRPKRLRELQ